MYFAFCKRKSLHFGEEDIVLAFSSHPINKREEDLYVSSYTAIFIKTHSDFEWDIWRDLCAGMYSIDRSETENEKKE